MRHGSWLLISITALVCACPARAPRPQAPAPQAPRSGPATPPGDRRAERPDSGSAREHRPEPARESRPEPARETRPEPRRAVFWADARAARIKEAEDKATPGGRAVLAAAREMIHKDVVVRGSCWDYANAVYARAGFKGWRQRETPYRSRTRGPYANPKLVRAGDWLFIINHPATLATHSLIFVYWSDLSKRRAMTVTYVGDNRDQGGYYRTYDISRIYQITRPKLRPPKLRSPKLRSPKLRSPKRPSQTGGKQN